MGERLGKVPQTEKRNREGGPEASGYPGFGAREGQSQPDPRASLWPPTASAHFPRALGGGGGRDFSTKQITNYIL